MVDGAEIALSWLTLKDGAADFLQRVSTNVGASKREAENVRYDLFHCGENSPNQYVIYEVYKTEEDAAVHKEQSHSKAWMPWLLDNVVEKGFDRRCYKVHDVRGDIRSLQGGDLTLDMELTIVHVSCKPGTENAFLDACFKNQAGVREAEPDCVRFDILQQKDDPARFVLFEAFTNAAAVAQHKTLQHYLSWRESVEEMMQDRRIGQKVFLAPLTENIPDFDIKARPSRAPHILRRRLIAQLTKVGVGDKVEVSAMSRILNCLAAGCCSKTDVDLFLHRLQCKGHVNIADFIDFIFEPSSENLKNEPSSRLLRTRNLFHMLDDLSSLSYAYFQGAYHDAKVVEKLQTWFAGVFFKGREVTSASEISADLPGLRCIMLRAASDWKEQEVIYGRTYVVVFRGLDLGKVGKLKHNTGDVDAALDICDQRYGFKLEDCEYVRELRDLLDCEALNEPGARYVFTGHGLGGVLALLAATYRSDCCAVSFAALAIKGGWAALLGDALLRTVNYFDADDPHLRIYAARGYGNDSALKEWLVVVPEGNRCIGCPQVLLRSVAACIRNVVAKDTLVSNQNIFEKLINDRVEKIDLSGILRYLAGGEMHHLQEMDAAISAAGVRVVAHYCK